MPDPAAPPIGLFRARDDAERTAEAVRRLGYAPIIAPVFETRALGGAPPDGDYALIIASSAQALRCAGPWLDRFATVPLALVGARTLEAARARGLRGAAQTFADAETLASELRSPSGAALYCAGRDRKAAIADALAARGAPFALVETYVAEPRAAWSAEETAALTKCGAFLHYSRLSAERAAALAERARIGAAFASRRHVCLSVDVAAALAERGIVRLSVAARPDEEALLAALGPASA